MLLMGPDGQSRRNAMIAGQLRVSKVNNPTVLAALRAVPREDFVPKDKAALAYLDEDIDLGGNRWMLQPLVFARLLEAANIGKSDRVLDVGCGLGYSATVLAELAQSVVAVECDATLAAKAATLLNGRAKLVVGPLELGSKENGPYDAILLNGAVDGVPAGLIDQMAVGGVMVGVKQEGSIGRAFVGRKSATGFGIDPFMDVMVPLLLGFAKPRGFVF